MLGQHQRDSFFFFLDTISSVLAESHDPGLLGNLEEQMNVALARLERDFPVSIQVNLQINKSLHLGTNLFLSI